MVGDTVKRCSLVIICHHNYCLTGKKKKGSFKQMSFECLLCARRFQVEIIQFSGEKMKLCSLIWGDCINNQVNL